MADLYRKSAFDTITRPEQLNKQVKIIRPTIWLIYVALVAAFVTFAVWSVTYTMSDGINISGVIFTHGSVIKHTADRACMVTDVLVVEGDYVNVGDIIAVLSYEEQLEQIENAREELSQMEKGSAEYDEKQENIDKLISEYIAKTMVKSNNSGYIQSVKSAGMALNAGDSVAMVISDQGYEEVIAYVPLQIVNHLRTGMTAQISPTYADREEYGYMTGVITNISDTPVSEEGIINMMGTLSYVADILPQESCVEVRIRLNLDDDSKNKYKWSNDKGEIIRVGLGTQCEIIVVTDEYHPIRLLLK